MQGLMPTVARYSSITLFLVSAQIHPSSRSIPNSKDTLCNSTTILFNTYSYFGHKWPQMNEHWSLEWTFRELWKKAIHFSPGKPNRSELYHLTREVYPMSDLVKVSCIYRIDTICSLFLRTDIFLQGIITIHWVTQKLRQHYNPLTSRRFSEVWDGPFYFWGVGVGQLPKKIPAQ